jgi:hypothetical protein
MDARQLYQVYFTGKVPHFCSESEAMDTNGFFSVEHWPLELAVLIHFKIT